MNWPFLGGQPPSRLVRPPRHSPDCPACTGELGRLSYDRRLSPPGLAVRRLLPMRPVSVVGRQCGGPVGLGEPAQQRGGGEQGSRKVGRRLRGDRGLR
jgi:hypothetical protein